MGEKGYHTFFCHGISDISGLVVRYIKSSLVRCAHSFRFDISDHSAWYIWYPTPDSVITLQYLYIDLSIYINLIFYFLDWRTRYVHTVWCHRTPGCMHEMWPLHEMIASALNPMRLSEGNATHRRAQIPMRWSGCLWCYLQRAPNLLMGFVFALLGMNLLCCNLLRSIYLFCLVRLNF